MHERSSARAYSLPPGGVVVTHDATPPNTPYGICCYYVLNG